MEGTHPTRWLGGSPNKSQTAIPLKGDTQVSFRRGENESGVSYLALDYLAGCLDLDCLLALVPPCSWGFRLAFAGLDCSGRTDGRMDGWLVSSFKGTPNVDCFPFGIPLTPIKKGTLRKSGATRML